MTKYIYCYRDKKLQCWNEPVYSNEDYEHVAQGTTRGLKNLEGQKALQARDKALYYLGTFDDINARFNLLDEPLKLLDCEDFVVLPGGDSDGTKE